VKRPARRCIARYRREHQKDVHRKRCRTQAGEQHDRTAAIQIHPEEFSRQAQGKQQRLRRSRQRAAWALRNVLWGFNAIQHIHCSGTSRQRLPRGTLPPCTIAIPMATITAASLFLPCRKIPPRRNGAANGARSGCSSLICGNSASGLRSHLRFLTTAKLANVGRAAYPEGSGRFAGRADRGAGSAARPARGLWNPQVFDDAVRGASGTSCSCA